MGKKAKRTDTLKAEKITATVTPHEPEPPVAAEIKPPEPYPEIPEMFLRNPDNSFKWPLVKKPSSGTSSKTGTTSSALTRSATSATAPGASPTSGGQSGTEPSSPIETDEFSKFRVSPDEIASKINKEADRRWREWMPTKTDRKRPRKSWYVKQVRKEYYP